MASNQVAKPLTIVYWIASIPFGASLIKYSARWIWVGWVLAVSILCSSTYSDFLAPGAA
ncbi:MAG TPA: hypothetical protein VK652_10350 [Steroidobacteraceae bacterium]|nr:hypothetical protein [Steroidobacteraceae bacterium]